jgi:hypothetical protein
MSQRLRKNPSKTAKAASVQAALGSPDDAEVIDSESSSDFESSPSKRLKIGTGKLPTTKPAPKGGPIGRKRRRVTTKTAGDLWDIIQSLDNKVAKLKYDLIQGKARAKEAAKGKKTTIDKKNETLGDLRSTTTTQKGKLRNLGDEIKVLEQTLREQNSIISALQAQALQKLDSSENTYDGDADVGAMFSKIFRSTKAFVRAHAISKWELVDHQVPKSTWELLEKVGQSAIASRKYGLPAILHGLIAPNVVTNALLNHYLVRMLLAHPFAVAAGFETQAINDFATAALQRIHTVSQGE